MKNKKGFIAIPLVLVIIALLATGGYVVYTKKTVSTPTPKKTTSKSDEVKEELNNPKVVSKQEETVVPVTNTTLVVNLSPKETYLRMATDYEKINTPEQYYEVQIKYNDEKTKQKNQQTLTKLEKGSFTEAEKNYYDNFLSKTIVPISKKIKSNIKDIKESISGNKATLTIQLSDGNTMKVDMVLENGTWRVVKDAIVF